MTDIKTAKKHRGHNLRGPGPGRPKGMPNKFTTLKNDYLWVHAAIGGRKRLKAWAETHLALFYQLESKLFPQEVETKQNVTYRVIYEKPKEKDKADANG